MMIWRLSQDINNGYDTWSDAVVIAPNEAVARSIHPSGSKRWNYERSCWQWETGEYEEWTDEGWAKPDQLQVELIGVAHGDVSTRLVCASFHAG